jgi:hypothetical protein
MFIQAHKVNSKGTEENTLAFGGKGGISTEEMRHRLRITKRSSNV